MTGFGKGVAGLLVVVLAAAGGFFAGRRERRAAASDDDSPTVATFRGGRLSAEELRSGLSQQGSVGRAQLEANRRVAQELVRQKLVEQDAVAKGYDRSPEALRERRRMLASLYLRGEVEGPANRQQLTDKDLQAWLDAHRAEFAQPERARVADLFVAAPASGPERQKRFQEAQALLRDLQRWSARDYYAFATAVRSRSDDLATKAFGGDLPLLSRAELEGRLGPEVAEAAFALRGTDTLGGRVVETPSGFHLLKLRARVEASSADLATLRERVRTRLAAERRTQAESDLYAGLERRAELHFDDAALAAVHAAGAGERTATR